MPKNMFDKIWEAHEVSDGLIYIDLHLVHEVTSPQAFDGLRLAGRPVRRPDKTLATADHNTPTDGTMAARLIADELSRVQVETLERNCEEFGIPLYSLGSDRQGIVHVIGPELGVTQPGMTIVCGDSHTSTHGAFGSLAFGIGTSEVEHVLATQCLVQKRPKTMRISYSGELGAGVTPKDLILATIGRLGTGGMTGHAVEYAGPAIEALSMPGRMTICNMTIEGGGRAGHDRPRRDDLRVGPRPRRARPRTSTPRSPRWRELPTDAGASFDTEVEIDAAAISPMVTWGTNPGMVVEVTDTVPDPAAMESPADRESAERALAYMDLEPGTPMTEVAPERVFIGSCTNSRIEDLREAAAVVDGRKVADSVRAMVVPGSQQVKAAAEAEGLRRRLPRRRLRMARGGLLDVPGDEPRHARRGRALRLDLEPQLRGSPGQGWAHPPGQPEDGGRGRHRGTFRRHPGLELKMRPIDVIEGKVSVLDRADVDTDQIIPKQFLKRVERTGFGEFLFYDWIRDGEIELEPNPILVTGRNFGSGSSREHAPWALEDFGFEAIVAPVLRRHLLRQLHQDRAAAGDPRRGALPRRRRGRRGADRRRRRDDHLRRRRLRVRGRARRQAPAAERPRRHRDHARERRRDRRLRGVRGGRHGPVDDEPLMARRPTREWDADELPARLRPA